MFLSSYDEPGTRATYNVSIQHHLSYSAICNTPEISRTPIDGTNMVETKFEKIPSVQSYLLAFIVSNFVFVQDTSGHVPHRIYAKPASIYNGDANMALGSSVHILNAYERYLGIPFTLPKMDQAALPNFAAGAMENWGLVTYRESSLLWNNITSLTSSKYGILSTVSHEFAVSL